MSKTDPELIYAVEENDNYNTCCISILTFEGKC